MGLVQTAVEGFAEYHKIDTLFERDEKFAVDPDRIKKPVLRTISLWNVTEKIDGTNIRVMLGQDGKLSFGGRSDNTQLPADLLMYLVNTFHAEDLKRVFWLDNVPVRAILYGEGYGAGIQKGAAYRADKAFILFDVMVGDCWLDWEDVRDVACKLGIDTVPYLGRWTFDEIVRYVQNGFKSAIGTAQAEGIVARPLEALYDKRKRRIIIKLKTKDFGKASLPPAQ
jgi:hypothetical protein